LVERIEFTTDSENMKAFCIDSQFGLENLKLVEREKENPEGLDPKSVRIKVKAVSLNYRDYLMITGRYNPRQKLPLIPCSDGVGEVIEIGSAVKDFQIGDRVAGTFAQDWLDGSPELQTLRSTLGGPLDGMLAEERVLPEHGCIRIPDHLTWEEAATLPCAGLTAYNAIVTYGNLRPGSFVLILGTGGVSLFALQFARMIGAYTIITSSSDEKLKKAKSVGAHQTINYKSKTNWEREVRKFTDLQGCDLVIEVGGAGTLPKSLLSVKPGGTVALIGVLAGGEANLSLYPILMQGIRVQGVIVGNKRQFGEMNKALAVHPSTKPVIDSIFEMEDAHNAFRHLESGAHFGKIVIKL